MHYSSVWVHGQTLLLKVTDAPKLYVLQKSKSASLFCLLSYVLFFIGEKITGDPFKDEITLSLNANDRLEFYPDVALNHVREKGKP